jgi:hypothetical protein
MYNQEVVIIALKPHPFSAAFALYCTAYTSDKLIPTTKTTGNFSGRRMFSFEDGELRASDFGYDSPPFFFGV